MALRKRCPLCNQRWPGQKDPIENDSNALMSLRVGDLCKGLKPSSMSMEADVFHSPCSPVGLRAMAQRLSEVEEAVWLIETALDRLKSAQGDLAATTVAMEAHDYIQEHGREIEGEGLGRSYRLDLDEFYVVSDGDILSFGEIGDE